MEQQDQHQPEPPSTTDEIILTQKAKVFLLETTKWGQFFAILGFIFTGLIVILALFMGTVLESVGQLSSMAYQQPNMQEAMQGASIFVTVLYLLFALLYFFPSLYLYRFASKTKLGLRANDNFDVEKGLENLKSAFKFWGIFTIIVLCLYALFFIGAMLFGAALGSAF